MAIDQVMPNRPVLRRIRGIDMVLPRHHILPYMAVEGSAYAQNLVDLAVLLGNANDGEKLVVLDVGANVGDSALLIRDVVNCQVVCVEGDPHWLTFLEKNVGSLPDVVIVAALLSAEGEHQFVSIVRADVGSSHVLPAAEAGGIATLPLDELLVRNPELRNVRLVKSDTDGFDVKLAVSYAHAFAASHPVIFFEYDPRPTRLVTPELDPSDVWAHLADLGYVEAAVWTNGGHVLGRCRTLDLFERSRHLEANRDSLEYQFWDVAVAHTDDRDGINALDTLTHQSKWVSAASWT
jgi:FkbM family methyltransferase